MRFTNTPLCADPAVDPEIFFPISEIDPREVEQTEKAKAICRSCRAQEECLEKALDGGPFTAFGVWGALTEQERRNLKRRRARSAA
ncbi:WhiB family transcriptional regulator [Streptosporangium sp. NPDC051022]|uniref:WhiB family transcriptional regulator n=1 Tax=Streptosporangium sp. NPDC051022 TaxID=3155752 RepID=UPI003419958C